MITQNTRPLLTDDMERQLMAQAIEAQFRPRPLRAVRKAFGQFLSILGAVAQRMAAARTNSFQTQAL